MDLTLCLGCSPIEGPGATMGMRTLPKVCHSGLSSALPLLAFSWPLCWTEAQNCVLKQLKHFTIWKCH